MTATAFPAGSLVRARGRDWLVIPGGTDGMLRARPLGGSDADTTLLLPDFDHPTPAVFTPPTVDDRGDAELGTWFIASTWFKADADFIAYCFATRKEAPDVR